MSIDKEANAWRALLDADEALSAAHSAHGYESEEHLGACVAADEADRLWRTAAGAGDEEVTIRQDGHGRVVALLASIRHNAHDVGPATGR